MYILPYRAVITWKIQGRNQVENLGAAESFHPGGNRVKVFENLGATVVAPVALQLRP